jgi:hypothetical protein
MKEILKTCTKCLQEYPATTEFFHKQSSTKDGLTTSCKACRKISDSVVYLKNKDLYVSRALNRWKKS